MRRSGWPAAVEPPLRRAGGEGTPRPAPPQVLLANSGTPGMKKNYVLDTNILLHDPSAIFKFEDNHVIIPIYVIEEVDQFKREGSERGRNARQVVRLLDDLRDAGGALSKGVPLKSGGMLRVAVPPRTPELPSAIDKSAMDNAILQTAFDVREEDGGRPTVFVTMDTNLRIRADALGMVAETYENQRADAERVESGAREFEVSADQIDTFFQEGRVAAPVPPPDPSEARAEGRSSSSNGQLSPNQCVLLRDRDNAQHTALGRFDAAKKEIVALRTPREGVMGIRPRNKEQAHALDLLLDENIRLVTLVGKAGTGKTLLALAAGLKRTLEDGMYTRMLVSRPVMPLGRDIGFLPGDVDEKLNPWMQPIFDNLEFLFASGTRKGPRAYAELLQSYPQLELLVISKPRPGGRTEQLVRRLGLVDRVRFVSGISTEQMVRYYAEAAIAVVPSVYEGFGLPAGEAMACGAPVVATDGGALPEVVGDAGVTVPARDAAALADALDSLLKDPARRQALGEKGRQRILEQFCWDVCAGQMVAYYRQVLANANR